MRVFVAIPTLDRRITCETAASLLQEQVAARESGDELVVGFAPGCSLITQARNHLVRDFMQSDCARMVFVDSDVAWEPGALLSIARRSEPFVGGAYRYKDDAEGYPVHFLECRDVAESGMVEVAMLPGGFLSLSRDVFATLFRETGAAGQYAFSGFNFYAFFHCPRGDGEDGAFCRDWRDAGGKVWLDPLLTLTHVDAAGRKYTGNIGQWMKRNG